MLARNAIVGCVHRQRTSHPLVEEKSCASAEPSEVAGNSVSPSAASDPVTPTIKHDKDAGDGAKRRNQPNFAAQISVFAAQHMRSERERRQQQQRVREVKREVPGPQRRLALRGQTKLDEQCAEIASISVNMTDGHGTPREPGDRGPLPQKSTSASPTAEKNDSPLVMRCVNSIIVFALAECCRTVPLHKGQ